MKTQLCKCNKCDCIMVDLNPHKQPEMKAPKDTKSMVLFEDIGGSYFYGCPNCHTDKYLIDVTEEAQL